MTKPLPKIARCVCGVQTLCYKQLDYWHVECRKGSCWFGPRRLTKRGAISAWNKVMGKGKGK